MSRRDAPRLEFLEAPDRDGYLRSHSGLPGLRANLELLDVASAAAAPAQLVRWAALDPIAAPENTPGVFLVAVGVAGLGRLVAAGRPGYLPELRRASNDPRWRVREAVAIGLQAWGDVDMAGLVDEMDRWADGSPLEGRAAMAALCEPRLLASRAIVARVLAVLDRLTEAVRSAQDKRSSDVRVLRQALGYGWSVAIAADPGLGVPAFQHWLTDPDPDVRWIVVQNLGKARLVKAESAWVERARRAASP